MKKNKRYIRAYISSEAEADIAPQDYHSITEEQKEKG
jgi:hypothetical protein